MKPEIYRIKKFLELEPKAKVLYSIIDGSKTVNLTLEDLKYLVEAHDKAQIFTEEE